jgi:hypothetical protein
LIKVGVLQSCAKRSFSSSQFHIRRILVNADHLDEALPCFERAAELGDARSASYAARLQHLLGRAPARLQQNGQEQVVRQLISIYQQVGEAGLQQVLIQEDIPAVQVDELIYVIKQASGE